MFSLVNASTVFMYPHETLMTINGVETLTYFIKGDQQKPLIILVPGNAHLARIFYGYPEGKRTDFLSYWINKKGYSLLAISYPLDHPVYKKVYPAFNIKDWGNLVISTTKKVIERNNLSKNIVIVGWSMAGSIVAVTPVAAKANGLNLQLFIGLSAVPPIPHLMHGSQFTMNKMLSNHLADRSALYPAFYDWLDEQSKYNHHEIIPREIYQSQFLGNIPIALGAEGYHYENGKFIFNIEKTLMESHIFNFQDLPWIAQIQDDSLLTLKISIIDPYGWYFLLTQMLFANYLNKNTPATKNLQRSIDHLLNELTITVHGNHLFFVGEKGAKETAEKIDCLVQKRQTILNSFVLE